MDVLLRPEGGSRLGVVRGAGACAWNSGEEVGWFVVESGSGTLTVGEKTVEVSGRTSVFERAGWSALVAPHTDLRLDGDASWTWVWRPSTRTDVQSRIIDPATVPEEDRGSGANARRVRTYVATGPLIAGETLNPPGGWSSYPPHRHEHEEVYVYRFDPPEGFGVAVNYESADDDGARVVRDGAVQRISTGYHPVVAAPGYAMYYLWALAGASDELTPEFDPVHASRA
jgi:5-deoxy-glucuronate isomerase